MLVAILMEKDDAVQKAWKNDRASDICDFSHRRFAYSLRF
jgi:hypothetical protein